MRERLIELFEEMDINPEITCPKPDDVEACKNCRYAIGLLCDIVARKVDYLLANGVIVTPCKVGDTVYTIFNGEIRRKTVVSIAVLYSTSVRSMQIRLQNERGAVGSYEKYDFGKTVFLTREQAEQALAERSEQG